MLIGACLAVFTCFVSMRLHPRFEHRYEVIHNQFAILAGQPELIDGQPQELPQFQSRVLFPIMLATVSRIHAFSVGEWYMLLRLLTAFLGFFCFLSVCRFGAGLPIKVSAAAAGLLAYGLIFTFHHGWEHPTDFLDVLFLSGGLWLCLRHRRVLLVLLVALGTLNHQTIAFLSIVWLFLWATESRRIIWSEAVYAFCVGISSYAESNSIKSLWFHQHGPTVIGDGYLTISQLQQFLHKPTPDGWPVLLVSMFCPVVLWLMSNRASFTGVPRRLVFASIATAAAGTPLAFWAELRSVFLPPLVIITLAAALAEGAPARVDLSLGKAA